MAGPQLPPAEVLTARLEELLERARNVKKSTSIEPPLLVADLLSDGEEVIPFIHENKDIHYNAIETATKRLFYSKICSIPIEDPSFVSVWNLLDIIQFCGDKDLCAGQLVLLLIEELFDSQSISGCRHAFTFLETRREALIANLNTNKSLVVLRLCNELLRRISRAEDPVFCGRVYIFMFQSFPLGDKSSVNQRGNFHTGNVTTFEDYLQETVADGDVMEVDNDTKAEKTESNDIKDERRPELAATNTERTNITLENKEGKKDIDALYPSFWSLQHSFSNPPMLFKEENFKHFQKSLEATLAKFREVPKVIQAGDPEQKKAEKVRSGDRGEAFASTFNPKYLTSRDLFKLELSDLAFQRHILVQALILIDFLLSLTEKAKAKFDPSGKANKSVVYPFTLGEEETEWALGIKTSIANYLQEGPDGKFYYRMVDTVLSRDKNWVRWKIEHCPQFTRDRVPTEDFLAAKSGADSELARKNIAKPPLRMSSLMFLSNTDAEKGLAKLRQTDRFTAPSVESYAKKVQTSELDLEMAASEDEKRQLEERKTSNTWRGLRLASKQRLSTLDRPGKGLERLFQPVTSTEAAGEEQSSTTGPEERDPVPQEQHQSVEEQRADQQSQVTTTNAAE